MNSQISRRSLARLLTGIENGDAAAQAQLREMYARSGKARTVGMTGAPGCGKSTLVTAMVKAWRAQGKTVAVVAVDPSSPFTNGAILGDRYRMNELAGDPGVFVRSMASRGALGGLASAVFDAVTAFDASGFDAVIVETVGAGQNEIDVAWVTESVIVVEAPGMGDEVQAIKAGIL
ncbi:MAG: AAA family ATPase, partial [Anaerolineae bacterium]|nr:AAA family ATPase [Anaerolineae bacterium]